MNKQKPSKDVDIVQVTSSWRGGQHRVGRKPCLEFISSSVTKSAAVTVGKSGWKKYAQPSEYSSDTLSGEQQTEVWPKNPPVNGKPPTSEPLMTTSQSLNHSISQVIYMHQSIIRHKYQTLQLWNRLIKMSDYRLPKIYIYNWDISHGHSWAKELKSLIYLNDFKAKCSSCIKKREVCGYRV